MNIKTRRWLVALMLVASITALTDVIVTQAKAGTESIAQSWAASMTPQERVEAAKQFDVYRAQYQRALYVAMTPDERAEFWRFRFHAYLRTHELSPEQIAVVEESISITYLPTEQWGDALKVADLAARAKRLLGADVRKFGGSRGAIAEAMEESATAASLPVSVRVRQFVVDTFVAHADIPDCDCSTDSDLCNGRAGQRCFYSITLCTPDNYWPGCGYFFAYRCDGLCKLDPIFQ